ncbi:hypothetical protein EVC35_06565 [Oenococcus sicerae]|uniref:Uncharacterized protein n=1 Tax=Oenococcus sicerae TaxID=2203724 RepID=A0AAJ1VNE3_9LACO|nr:hypothetical protein [Oenococcus sicerae]
MSDQKNNNSDGVDTTRTTTKSPILPAETASVDDNGSAKDLKGKKNFFILYYRNFWRSIFFTLGVVLIISYILHFHSNQWFYDLALYTGTFFILYPICSLYFFKKK